MTNNEIIALNCAVHGITEQVHTYAAWLANGYRVKPGEHAVMEFPIWRYTSKQVTDGDSDEVKLESHCYMKKSHWFARSQVEQVS